MADRSDIVIAGGSFAGLALAAALAHEGRGDLSVVLVAPSLPPPAPDGTDVRASALSRGSLRLLDRLGVWREIAPHAEIVRRIELTDSATADAVRPTMLAYELEAADVGGEGWDAIPAMVVVENQRLGAALSRHVRAQRGVRIAQGTSVEGYTVEDSGVQVTLTNGSVERARLAVAADGERSRLREAAGIRSIGWSYDQIGIVTVVEGEMAHGGTAVQHFLPGGPIALLPMTGGRTCVTWSEQRDVARGVLALPPSEFRAVLEARVGDRLGALKSVLPPQSWPLALGLARALAAERVALVGDAAHKVHPLAGQGLNQGFRDVAALAECIIDDARLGLDFGRPETLERYAQMRRFDMTASAMAFDFLNRAFSRSSPMARSARGAALRVADRLGTLKGWLVAEAAGDSAGAPRLMLPA